MTLAALDKDCSATIAGLGTPENDAVGEHIERLMELGFLPGETVRVIAKGFPSGEPIAVRIGQATFALRRFEAELIRLHDDSRRTP